MSEPNYLPREPTLTEDRRVRGLIVRLQDIDTEARTHDLMTPAELELLLALRSRLRARVRHFGYGTGGAYDAATERLLAAAQAIGEEVRP